MAEHKVNEYKITYQSLFKRSDYIKAVYYSPVNGFFDFKSNAPHGIELIASISMETVLSVVRQKSGG